MANVNIANLKPPQSPNLPLAPTAYDQQYFNILTNVLRLYFNQLDLLTSTIITPDIGYFLNMPYGAFLDTTTQTAAAINTPYAVTFNTQSLEDSTRNLFPGQPDIFINPLDASQIVVLFPAIYDFEFSLQLEKATSSLKYVWVWARVNGIDVDDSATKVAIQGNGAAAVAAWNFLLEIKNPGDYFQLMWAVEDTDIEIVAEAATAFCPSIPSAILTVSGISA